ncbi:hypothetical protein BRD02_05515 [Halobacteriales archaeon QS_8_69_73]|nr:MAG: hypothetical protein BRD02_05515 [Halobacteriales archaeon QS_8_69_73]
MKHTDSALGRGPISGRPVGPTTGHTPGHYSGVLRSFDGVEPAVHEDAGVDPVAVVGDVTPEADAGSGRWSERRLSRRVASSAPAGGCPQ